MKLCSSDNHYTTDCHSPALLDLLFSSVASICSAKAFPPLGNSDHVVSVSTDFPSNSQWNTLFQWIGYDYSFSDSDNSGAQDLSLENSANFYLCFWLALFLSVFYFFFLYWSPSSSLCTVFDSISPKINEVVSISPYANVFVFGNFNVHQRDWLIYSGKVDRPSELCYNFSISNAQMTILRWLAFLLGFLTVTLTVLLFWFYFFLLLLLFVQQWLSLYWLEKILIVLSQFLVTFCQTHSRVPCFIEWLVTTLVQIMTIFLEILWRFFLMFLTDFSSLSVLRLFHVSVTFFIFMHSFWFCFL